MKNFLRQTAPFLVPVPDNKIIEEHFGMASIFAGDFSIAHIIAPAGWSEPHQTPDFDEVTMVVRGRKLIEVDGERIELQPGESVFIRRGARVRYSNPFEAEAEYWSVCIPAFTIERVHREEESHFA